MKRSKTTSSVTSVITALAVVVLIAVVFKAGAATTKKQSLKMEEGGTGFGGMITNITSCICEDLGVMITVKGDNGGDFLFSFKSPPTIKVGQFFSTKNMILGGADKKMTCGTRIDRGCKDKEDVTRIKYVGSEE